MSEMELLPRHHADFSRKEYWDEFFTKRQEKAFEWYGDYAALRPWLHKTVKPSERVLVVGCGNSDLTPKWAQDGYLNITSMDFSALVIDEMKHKYPALQWDVMDMTQMTYGDECFECVMDKGALDALMSTNEAPVLADATSMFHHVDRILAPGGSYICITMAQDFIVNYLLTAFAEHRSYKISVVDVPRSNASPFVPFLVVLTKVAGTKESPDVVKYSDKVFRHDSGVVRKQWLLHEMEATQWYIMSQRDLKKIQVGRQQVIELMSSSPNSVNTTPRYTIRLVDVHLKGPNGACGVFLVPQGREHEYLFATEEGAAELASGAGFSRFLIVSLGRTHVFTSLEAVQLELNPKMMELCPDTLGRDEKIPYMTVQEGLGERHVIGQGTSDLSGDYFIEEVDMHRRLVFLSNSSTIQSEIKLLPPLTAKQLKEKAKKNKKKSGDASTASVVRFDRSYLAFEYHKSMVALLHYYNHDLVHAQPERQGLKSALVGLGGGALASFIQASMSTSIASLTACELDPSVVAVAKEFFGLQTNARLDVVVQDGLDFIAQAAPSSLDAILLDVDAKSSHEKTMGLTAPPLDFVTDTFFQTVVSALSDHGIFLVNVSCRSSSTYQDILAKLRRAFGGHRDAVVELKASEQDVNRIVCATKGKTIDLASWRRQTFAVPPLAGFESDEVDNLIGLIDVAE
ncbi:hypothetical protein LEN26_013926 [Aphanomyces euteiches]|nr:hypothetical protein AeMF1_019676 [Aphanomyces euteiches]KAH9109823.1 hypothetical protein LEN26_013926 [Aphanomyces euteiches]KAH9186395.1 hypothetical protein AeNC1_011632 [Aphanomyces euteiches]